MNKNSTSGNNDATANYTAAHEEANEKMKESLERPKEQSDPTAIKEPTPQELQQKIHSENLKNQIINNKAGYDTTPKLPFEKASVLPKLAPELTEIEAGTLAVVAAIEAGTPFIVFLDDGKQVTLSSSKLSQPAILGLLVKFALKIATNEEMLGHDHG